MLTLWPRNDCLLSLVLLSDSTLVGSTPLLCSNSLSISSTFFPDTIRFCSLQADFKTLTLSSSSLTVTVLLPPAGLRTLMSSGISWVFVNGLTFSIPAVLGFNIAWAFSVNEAGRFFISSGSFWTRTPLGYCCCSTCSWRNSCCCCRSKVYGVSDCEGGFDTELVLPPLAPLLLGGMYSW